MVLSRSTISIKVVILLLVGLLGLPAFSSAQESSPNQNRNSTAGSGKTIAVRVDCNRLFLGASTLLRVRALKESEDVTLDLAPLAADFEVLKLNVVDGGWNMNRNLATPTVWVVELKPKRTGQLTIPALPLGPHRTNVVPLTVEEQGAGQRAELQEHIFVEIDVQPRQAYVQSQILYTVRMYYSDQLASGTLSEPEFPSAFSQQLGNLRTGEEQRDGIKYRLTERRFAVFPEHSGKVTLPALQFQGEVSYQGVHTAAQSGRGMRCRTPLIFETESVELDILPRPPQFQAPYWLPATNVTVASEWVSRPATLRVGTPLVRNITITAMSLDPAKLPELAFAEIEGTRIYTELAEVHSEQDDKHGYTSRWQQTVTIIPTRTGSFSLPELRIPWWNTLSNRAEAATLPAETFRIQALVSTVAAKTESRSIQSKLLWLGGGLLLVVLVVMLMRFFSPALVAAQPYSAAAALWCLWIACGRNNAKAAAAALFAWGKAIWPDDPPQSLPAFAQRLQGNATSIYNLDRILYQQLDVESQWHDGKALWQLLQAEWRQRTIMSSKTLLAPLYPLRRWPITAY